MDKEVLDYIEKHQLSSFMNNMKWRRFIRAIHSKAEYRPRVNIKYIFDEEEKEEKGFCEVWWNEVERDGKRWF